MSLNQYEYEYTHSKPRPRPDDTVAIILRSIQEEQWKRDAARKSAMKGFFRRLFNSKAKA